MSKTKILAKLLATENIRVEHRKVPTAYFELVNRLLVIPIFKEEMPVEVEELLIGHEVGHAKQTPPAGWHDAVSQKKRGFKTFLNVIEDVRIEKGIKEEYPGLKKSFYTGYKHLFEKDFFGVKDEDVNSLMLIDRINLHYKIGSFLGITFSKEEKEFLSKIDSVKTWEDTERVALELYDYSKKELEKREKEDWDDFFDDLDSEESLDDWDGDTEMDMDFDEEVDEKEKKRRGRKSFNSDSMTSYDPHSLTDEAYRRNENQLFDDACLESTYCYFPKLNPMDFIIPYSKVKDILNLEKSSGYYYYNPTEELPRENLYLNFLNQNTKYISYLVKEFELKKNAQQLAKAKQSKTGILDMNKVWSYKFNDEMFKSATHVPKGKNHGLLMFVDWSGSMQDHLPGTIEQILVLIHFCRKVNIPYRVYAFCAGDINTVLKKPKGHDIKKLEHLPGEIIVNNGFYLAEFFSNEMSRTDFMYMTNKFLDIAEAFRKPFNHQYITGISLAATPLNEAIIAARWLIPMFQKELKLENVNTIFITDGEGHRVSHTVNGDIFRGVYGQVRKKIILIDEKSREEESIILTTGDKLEAANTNLFLSLVRKVTKTNIIGFYITNYRRIPFQYFKSDTVEEKQKEFSREKFVAATNSGFTDYYIIKGGEHLTVQDETLTVKGTTKNAILRSFVKNQSKKALNRILLNRFVGLIA